MTAARQALAREAEAIAARHLESQGFRIVGRNVRVGRLELDLLAERAGTLVVCEVRGRRDSRYGSPAETISEAKIARVRMATERWLVDSGYEDHAIRLDAASVTFDGPEGAPRLMYYEAAF